MFGKLRYARQMNPIFHEMVWAERLANVRRSWSPSFVKAAARRRVAVYGTVTR